MIIYIYVYVYNICMYIYIYTLYIVLLSYIYIISQDKSHPIPGPEPRPAHLLTAAGALLGWCLSFGWSAESIGAVEKPCRQCNGAVVAGWWSLHPPKKYIGSKIRVTKNRYKILNNGRTDQPKIGLYVAIMEYFASKNGDLTTPSPVNTWDLRILNQPKDVELTNKTWWLWKWV